MSTAVLTDVADAVVTALNDASLSQSFTATRAYAPPKSIKDVKELVVLVVPGSVERELAARSLKSELYRIDVAVLKQIDPDDNTTLDPLTHLVEEIGDLLITERPADYTSAVCIRVSNDPVWDPDHLRSLRVFTSVVQAFYRVMR